MRFFLAMATLFSSQVFASQAPLCAAQAVRAAVTQNFENFGAGTSSCGIKALLLAEQREAYIVCTTDETDPMEYIVVMKNKGCQLEYVDVVTDSNTPNFGEDDENLIDVPGCAVDSSDSKVICQE